MAGKRGGRAWRHATGRPAPRRRRSSLGGPSRPALGLVPRGGAGHATRRCLRAPVRIWLRCHIRTVFGTLPLLIMALSTTYRRRLRERAVDQYGYITTRDAKELGIPPGELRKLRQRGGLEHIGHGIYRFEDIPRADRDQLMEAVLR